MNFEQAATLLGVSTSASHSEARKAYLGRARLLHPDRFAGGTAEEVAAANAAMAQLNEAWEVFQEGPDASTSSPRDESGPAPDFPVYPGVDICDFCGWGPATEVTYNSVTGMILFWRWGRLEAELCRSCGLGMYHESQRQTLTRGWWGIIAPIATVVAFVNNIIQVQKVKQLSRPQGKNPFIPTLSPIPMIWFTPWYKRPLALIATGVALFIIVSLASSVVQPSSSTTAPRTNPVAPTAPNPPAPAEPNPPAPTDASDEQMVLTSDGVGMCFRDAEGDNMRAVNCASPLAIYKGTNNVSNPDQCVDYSYDGSYLIWEPGEYLCLGLP